MSEAQQEILKAIEEEISMAPAEKINTDKFLLDWVTTVTVNQCDGCHRGLKEEKGIHYVDGKIYMSCEKRKY